MLVPRSISDSVDGIARKSLGRDWAVYAALFEHWREVVGEDYATSTTPVKIAFPAPRPAKNAQGMAVPPSREGGTLHIKLPRGMMMEFSFLTEQIKGRIASFLGRNTITKVVLEPSVEGENEEPLEAEEIPLTSEEKRLFDKELATIEDEGLRAHLAALGEAVLKDRKKKRF